MPFSIGLAELVVLAGAAGLVVLIVAAIVAAVVRRRNRDDTHPWKWIAILALILVVLPLFAVLLGILWMTPPLSTPTGSSNLGLLSLNPHSTLDAFVILPVVAGLVLLAGAVVVSIVLRKWRGIYLEDADADRGDGGKRAKMAKIRYVLLALLFWIALSILLALDLWASVSLYPTFVAIYAAFWVLVGALLLHGRPLREKALVLLLFLLIVFSVRFVDWNSRKPFLRDLYSIQEGMTPAQVEQIMRAYMKGGGRPLDSPETEVDERGEIGTGTVTYRHTDEGWGDSDWGVVTFENGRVVEIEFLPD